MTIHVQLGDSLEVLRRLPADSISAVVTDPPYGLGKPPDMVEVLTAWLAGVPYVPKGKGFMGKEWDAFVPGPELWREVFRVLKPGAHAAVFAGTRTQDVMGLALRLAGFEVRDSVAWLYGSGFPKSLDVSKAIDASMGAESAAWAGWGTALKPGHEPILIVRKPLHGTVAGNVLTHGTGGIHVDAGRLDNGESTQRNNTAEMGFHGGNVSAEYTTGSTLGRWPANVALDEATAADLDETVGNRPGMSGGGKHPNGGSTAIAFGSGDASEEHLRADNGGPSRFFYCPKASRSEREAGLTAANMLCECKPWAQEDQSQETAERAAFPKKATGGSHEVDGSSWSTDGCGSKPVGELSQRASTSTTSTRTSSTTGSRTSLSSIGSHTSGSTQVAHGTAPSGESLAGSAASSSPLEPQTGICPKKVGPSTAGADRVTSESLSKARGPAVCPVCHRLQRVPSAGDLVGRETGAPGTQSPRAGAGRQSKGRLNFHNTVKPVALMQWLLRLLVPPGGVVLDPFGGSGTTGIAAVREGFDALLIEREAEYVELAKARIAHAMEGIE